jgi:hypothetical protein
MEKLVEHPHDYPPPPRPQVIVVIQSNAKPTNLVGMHLAQNTIFLPIHKWQDRRIPKKGHRLSLLAGRIRSYPHQLK